MRKTNILPWTDKWAKSYELEANKLKQIFRDEIIEIFHIGSTSIPTIGYAKPIIDILIVVKEIDKVDFYNEKMRLEGYEPKGEYGIEGRRYFPKSNNEHTQHRTHHVHIFQVGHGAIKGHLNFKEYLLLHPKRAKAYGDLKIALAKQFPDNHYDYQEGKQEFVEELVKEARDWAKKIK
ncbi:hypothetical protein CIB95_04190 [Lottiidibacillus patelloidae]|uniref:GrpB family protein n=1 Tax=Lottiidibacillus patelloidae TaxID=2670334 RepID=A0A263BVH9_9BACI|nr:GrpB family protein [Lottiidibacillus patelloidae]OZM57578.1 hypothetical protein CIB95_04190 [Lottiidibacillus patelloidae]